MNPFSVTYASTGCTHTAMGFQNMNLKYLVKALKIGTVKTVVVKYSLTTYLILYLLLQIHVKLLWKQSSTEIELNSKMYVLFKRAAVKTVKMHAWHPYLQKSYTAPAELEFHSTECRIWHRCDTQRNRTSVVSFLRRRGKA